MTATRRLLRARLDVLTGLIALGAWFTVAAAWQPLWLPGPIPVLTTAVDLIASGAMSVLAVSARTLLIGLIVTFVLAGTLAVLMSSRPVMDRILTPYVNGLLATPQIALLPVFTFIWGTGEVTRVVTTIAFALAPVTLTWATALRASAAELSEMATSFGAGPVRRVLHVRLPNAAAPLIAGLRIGIMQGIKGVVGAEVLIGVVGLGRLITEASFSFDMVSLAAIAVIIIAVSVIVYVGLVLLENWMLRWNTT